MRSIALKTLCIAALMWFTPCAFAQDTNSAPAADAAPAPDNSNAETTPTANPADPDASTAQAPKKDAPPPQDPDDPGNIVANYFTTMTDIVAQNLNTPAVLIEKFGAFIKENEKSMRKASEKFDKKMKKLKPGEAEVYRETVQRKITPQLNKLITLLIDFANKYPAEAQKLDSMLKVDAKYTYQR